MVNGNAWGFLGMQIILQWVGTSRRIFGWKGTIESCFFGIQWSVVMGGVALQLQARGGHLLIKTGSRGDAEGAEKDEFEEREIAS